MNLHSRSCISRSCTVKIELMSVNRVSNKYGYKDSQPTPLVSQMAGVQFPSRKARALLSDGAVVVFDSAASREGDIVANVVDHVVAVGETCGTATATPETKTRMNPASCILSRTDPGGSLCSGR